MSLFVFFLAIFSDHFIEISSTPICNEFTPRSTGRECTPYSPALKELIHYNRVIPTAFFNGKIRPHQSTQFSVPLETIDEHDLTLHESSLPTTEHYPDPYGYDYKYYAGLCEPSLANTDPYSSDYAYYAAQCGPKFANKDPYSSDYAYYASFYDSETPIDTVTDASGSKSENPESGDVESADEELSGGELADTELEEYSEDLDKDGSNFSWNDNDDENCLRHHLSLDQQEDESSERGSPTTRTFNFGVRSHFE